MTSCQADAETALNRLIAAGYRFVHPCDSEGNIVAVVGVRAHDAVVDVVRIDGEDDATATRMPGDEEDVLEPGKALWQQTGAVGEVVAALLALADEEFAASREPLTGCWVPASPGRSAFLMAS